MKLSQGFWQTYKEVPADAEIPSHQLMLRAGLILKTSSGLYTHLPMGLRVIQKFEKIVREELNKINCHELLPPFVTPGELWKESGRWDAMGPEMLRATDRLDRDICLSPTNEEAFTDIFRKTVNSYKQLPLSLYQINTKYRDEIRPRYGLMRCREFIMKDAYTFHLDKACLDKGYDQLFKAYENIFKRAGLKFIAVEADGGAMAEGNAKTHEFQVLASSGEDKVIHCPSCDYAANVEKAKTNRANCEFEKSSESYKEVHTPSTGTIAEVCEFLKTEKYQSLKSLVYTSVKGDESESVLVMLLGDDELNELKLANFLKSDHLNPAKDSELKEMDLIKGFIGPVGLKNPLRIILDEAIDLESSYVCGANKNDYHFENMVPKRDIVNFEVQDLREARAKDSCSNCGSDVEEIRGVEVGHIFQLGDKYSKSMGVSVLDQNGKAQTPLMGCYGVGITRTVAAAIEQHHDENGIIWPAALAPYDIYFAVISKNKEFIDQAEELYNEMKAAGLEVLMDDRKSGPGFKFKDSDLLGLPIRVTMGERDFKADQMLEVFIRKTGEKFKVTTKELIEKVNNKLSEL